jgi:hypothetical protein
MLAPDEGSDRLNWLCCPGVLNHPDGKVILGIGATFLIISLLEIVLRKRPFASQLDRSTAWFGRLVAIGVWLMMIYSGLWWMGVW